MWIIVIIVVSASYVIFIKKMPMTALTTYFLLKTEGKILQSRALRVYCRESTTDALLCP
jgi:hypothetical protein